MTKERIGPTSRVRSPRRGPAVRRTETGWLVWMGFAFAFVACQGPMPQPLPAPSEPAQAAFLRARMALAWDASPEQAWQDLKEAQALAPAWAAPARLEDDLRAGWLQGPAAVRERWEAWLDASQPSTKAVAGYLLGRPLGVDLGQ